MLTMPTLKIPWSNFRAEMLFFYLLKYIQDEVGGLVIW